MGIYTQQLQQLYIAYYKRPADPAGLAQWEAVAAAHGMAAVLDGFSDSAEYQSLYAGLRNEQVVDALYQNLFGRDAESAGQAYWTQLLDSGALTLRTLPGAMMAGALAADVSALANKTSAASAFTAALDTATKVAGYSGAAANDIARAWLATVTEHASSLGTANTAMPTVLANAVDAGHGITHGKLVDGYIAGATIFADANGNGRWDAGEARTVTDANGNFTLTNAKGALIATGGLDLGTNLPFSGVMRAPEGATVVNPLTTLQQSLIQQGQSVDQAQATLAQVFHLSVANLDFDQRDPLEAAYAANASAAQRLQAVQMQAVAAKLQNLLTTTSQTLGGAMAGLSATDAANAAAKALATVLSHTDGDVSLSDTALLRAVLTGAASAAGANAEQGAAVAALADGFSGVVAATAQHIDSIVVAASTGSMTSDLAQARILQVETATQGQLANLLHDAAASGHMAQTVQQLGGSQLTQLILDTKIGDVVPGAASDTSAIDIVNGRPAAPADSTPPAAPTALALAAEDDTGVSSSDGVTRLSSGLTITGHAEADSRVSVYEDDGAGHLTLLGTATATGGSFSVDVSLAAGSHKLVARATDSEGNTGLASSPLTIQVDNAGPSALKVSDVEEYRATYLALTYGDQAVAGNSLVQVGGSHGFGTELTALDADDNFTGIDVAAAFANGLKLGATTYSALNQVFVGVNGYLTFGAGNSSYSAAGIAGYTTSPMIAAQFDDIYGGKAIAQSPGGTSTGSNHIYYNVDAAAHIVTVTWDDVAPFTNGSVAGSDYSHGNAYQIRLHWLQDSDFLIEMRYESMSWIGGNGGLPTAGWTAGDGKTYGEVQGSGTSAMLNLAGTSNFGHAGVYLWEVKNGVVTEHLIDINDARGKVVFNLNASDGAGSAGLNYTLADGADSRFSIVNGNQIAVKADAQFDLAHESSVTLPLVVTDAAGNVLQQNVVMTLFASPDVTAPTLASASPADGASAVATDAALVLTFSEAVQAGSGVIKLVQDGSEGVSIDIAVNSSAVVFNGGTVTITPPAGLLHDASYHVEIASGVIQDAAHNAYAGISNATTLNFHTAADTQAPTLASASPADDATAVATNASLVLTFNEAVQAGSGAIKLVQDGGSSVDIAVTSSEVVFNGKTVTITPTAGLQAGTHYHIEMASGVIEDTAHNAYAGISDATTLNFSTAADTLAPTLTSSSPADGATAVAVGSALVLTFNENVQAGTGVIKLVQDGGSGNAVDIAVNSSAVVFSGHTVTIDPIGDLVAGASYHLEMAGGVIEDLAHNAYAGISDATTLNFNTAGGDTTAPHLVSSEPADDDTYVYRRDPVVLTFDEGVKAGSGNIEFYYDSGEGVYLEASVAVTDTSQVSFNGSTMTITLTNGFDAVEGHPHPISVQLASGVVVDLVGNPYAGISDHTTLNFVVNEPT